MTIAIYVVALLFFLLLFAIGMANHTDVTVDLFVRSIGPVRLGAVIAGAAIAGVAFACALGVVDGIKIRVANRQLRRLLRKTEEDADALRLRLSRHEPSPPAPGPHETSRPAAGRDGRSF